MPSSQSATEKQRYRGRLAPSPTGWLHLGHARTFWLAAERARTQHGTLVLRNEDLDQSRSRPEFVQGMLEDLRWLGIEWQEGPDFGGPFAPYSQSERMASYRAAWEELRERGAIYPCTCSRRDVRLAAQAPHPEDDELIYPGTCRPRSKTRQHPAASVPSLAKPAGRVHWRFRVPDGELIRFEDRQFGPQQFEAGRDFGDFVVWHGDGRPSYQLAVVVDDSAMAITEVVRGADLLISTARQILLYRALELEPPAFFHCPLLRDARGDRLAKRHDALSLREFRRRGISPAELRQLWGAPCASVSERSPAFGRLK